MTNTDMKPNRFAKWSKAKKRLAWVKEQFNAGKNVMVVTHTKGTVYKPEHVEMFKATKSGFFVQAGKGYVCLDFTNIVAQ